MQAVGLLTLMRWGKSVDALIQLQPFRNWGTCCTASVSEAQPVTSQQRGSLHPGGESAAISLPIYQLSSSGVSFVSLLRRQTLDPPVGFGPSNHVNVFL